MGNLIDANNITSHHDVVDGMTTYRWWKNNEMVYELIISDRKMNDNYPYCPACLILRGEPIQMKRDKERRLFVCPTCKGRIGYGEHVFCTCKEIPHRISCPMGYNNYFSHEVVDDRLG